MDFVHAWRRREAAKCSTPVVRRGASASPSDVPPFLLGYGFPRHYRLTSSRQFQAVLRAPQYVVRRGALRILANANTMHGARLGLIVAKRDIRRANERNQVKRIVREIFRLERDELPAVDMIVQVRSAATGRQAPHALALSVREAFDELARIGTGTTALTSNKRNEGV